MTGAALDLSDRDRVLGALEAETFDILVIGGGITGAGIARDAALRGLRTALIEARDFASGTSSRSTKLIHGGLRYLARGHVGLVREAARERTILARIAPHLARKTPLILPARSHADLALRRAGLALYQRLGNVPRADRFALWSAERLRQEEPALRTNGLVGAAVYPEYVTDDARLVIANVRSAMVAGAVVANYTAAEEFILERGRLVGALARETLPDSMRKARVKARLIINAAGPWVDAVRQLEEPDAAPKLTLTQGVHLVFREAALRISRMVLMTASDGRGIFAVPRGSFVYGGTTDVIHPQAEYWPKIGESDVDYLLETINRSFATEPLSRKSIVSMWSGLRPLVAQPSKGPSEISRKDEIFEGPTGLITIAGGKLTAYRRMAERAVDLALRRLGRGAQKAVTAEETLPGGDFAGGIDVLISKITRRGMSDASRLAHLYGGEAEAISVAGGDAAAEARHAVVNEGAVTLEDYWVRRSACAWFPTEEEGALRAAAAAMAPLLGWGDEETQRQIASLRQ